MIFCPSSLIINEIKSCATSLKPSFVTILNGLDKLYFPFTILSAVGSTPSMFTPFTVSFKEPNEMYPTAFLFPATVVITISVLLEIIASSVVLSILFPSLSFSSTPVNSTNALRVPEPSSLETTEIAVSPFLLPPFALFPHPTIPTTNRALSANPTAFLTFLLVLTIIFLLF